MVSYLTISQKHLPCPPCGKMGLQSSTVVVAINKLWKLILIKAVCVVVMSLGSLRLSPGSTSQWCQTYFVLLPQEWPVRMMGEIVRLCVGNTCWLLQNGRGWGCENGGAGVCGVDHWGWVWISANACVWICWRCRTSVGVECATARSFFKSQWGARETEIESLI